MLGKIPYLETCLNDIGKHAAALHFYLNGASQINVSKLYPYLSSGWRVQRPGLDRCHRGVLQQWPVQRCSKSPKGMAEPDLMRGTELLLDFVPFLFLVMFPVTMMDLVYTALSKQHARIPDCITSDCKSAIFFSCVARK